MLWLLIITFYHLHLPQSESKNITSVLKLECQSLCQWTFCSRLDCTAMPSCSTAMSWRNNIGKDKNVYTQLIITTCWTLWTNSDWEELLWDMQSPWGHTLPCSKQPPDELEPEWVWSRTDQESHNIMLQKSIIKITHAFSPWSHSFVFCKGSAELLPCTWLSGRVCGGRCTWTRGESAWG